MSHGNLFATRLNGAHVSAGSPHSEKSTKARIYDVKNPLVRPPAHLCLLRALCRSPHFFLLHHHQHHWDPHCTSHSRPSSITPRPVRLLPCLRSQRGLSLTGLFPPPLPPARNTSTFPPSSVVLNLGQFWPPGTFDNVLRDF